MIWDQTWAECFFFFFFAIRCNYCRISIIFTVWSHLLIITTSMVRVLPSAQVWWYTKTKTRCVCALQKHYVLQTGIFSDTEEKQHRLRVIRGTKTGWVPVGTEEEERRLSNSEKSSLDVPLDVLNGSKLPERRQCVHTQMQTHTHKRQKHNHTKTNGNRQHKYRWVWIID